MKILFLQETDWLKRGPHQQHHLADRLSLRGHEIRVIDYEFSWRTERRHKLFSRRQVFADVFKIDNQAKVTVLRPGIIKIPFLDYLSLIVNHKKEIDHQIKEFAPDVIVGFGILNGYIGARAARRHNIPFVYYWIDVLHRLIPAKSLQPLGELLEKKTIQNSSQILVINERLGDYVASLGASPESIKVIKAGIDITKFDLQVTGDGIRQKYKIDAEDKVLFFMGWLYHFSGLKEAALKLAESDNKSLKFLIVGEGDALAELKKIQAGHNLADRLILTGKQTYQDIPGFVASSDICLLPAYKEEPIMQDIVPIKLYEYMAMKKPVISTRLPGVMREFGDGNGIVFVDKPEDVVIRATELIASGKYKELGTRARQFVERNNWVNITDEFEKTLQEVIEKK